jgi:hypothetical protein
MNRRLETSSVSSSDGVKNSNKYEQSAQTPSPDEPTLELKEQQFIRR